MLKVVLKFWMQNWMELCKGLEKNCLYLFFVQFLIRTYTAAFQHFSLLFSKNVIAMLKMFCNWTGEFASELLRFCQRDIAKTLCNLRTDT